MEIKMGIDLKPWQEELVKATAGKKPGELVVMMSGRNVGKSILSSMAAYQRMMNDLYNRPVEDLILSEGRIAGSRYHCVEPKGGSWKDRAYWMSPGARRFLDQRLSTDYIGFRCAMQRVGSPTGFSQGAQKKRK